MENGALTEDVAAAVRRQVEFYFSDSNLPTDNFLLGAVQESDDGLVSLPVICAFSKMRNYLKLKDVTPETVPEDVVAAVAEALRKSPSLRVSEDGKRVGRSSKLLSPEEARANLNARSVVASPFPYKTTREEVEAFFETYSKVCSLRMPNHPKEGIFSGYVVVEFTSPEEAQGVSAMKLNYQGADLKFQSRESFDKHMSSLGRKENSASEDTYDKGLIVKFKLEKLAKKKAAEDKEKKEDKMEVAPAEEKADEAEKKEAAKEGEQDKKEEDISREDIKAVLQEYGSVKFIDFTRGATSGYIRFETAEDANKARTAAVVAEAGGLVIKDRVATLEALEGDEERDYWKNIVKGRKDKHGYHKGKGRFGKGDKGGRRDKWQKQKKVPVPTGKRTRLDDDGDEPEAKAQKSE